MKYKRFGNSGLRVSELALGTMSFGESWSWGADKNESKKMFDLFAEQGGNFIDTANHYTNGESEEFLGDFLTADRDHFVVGTKYTLYDRKDDVNFAGNHRKNMMRSVEASLRRLKTDYIDLLWLHAWDFLTPVEEVMRGLDDLVRSGKVHYIGISDTPAWIVSQANTLAQLKSYVPFAGLQIEYNLIERTAERDLIPMAKAFGMTITPWSPLASGLLTGRYLKGGTGRVSESNPRFNERNNQIVQTVLDIAEKVGATPAQVAIRWTMQQDIDSIPILGGSKSTHFEDNLAAANLVLDQADIEKLKEVSSIELGFPHEFLAREGVRDRIYSEQKEQLMGI